MLKAAAAMMLVLCLVMGMIPMAFAGQSVGTSAGYVARSAVKTYIKLSTDVTFFTGDLEGTGNTVKPGVGSVCQLVSDDWYTGSDGKEYYSVYWLNQRYNVLKSDVAADVMTAAQLETYITGTLWKQSVYATLRKSMNLVADVRVHAVQLALQRLGYYTGALDGDYGKGTHDAVAKFQRQKGLDADGSAGPLTQPVLFALASGSTTVGGTSTGTSTGSSSGSVGTLYTVAQVNLRKYASTGSTRLASIPKNTSLTYTDTYSGSGGVTWYQVRYASKTGWVMGTYVSLTGGSSSGSTGSSSSSGSAGTLRTATSVNLRKYASTGSARLGVVPASISLSYTDSYTTKGITWYQVRYGGHTGWVMGTYVTVTSVSSGSTGSGTVTGGSASSVAIGKVTITMPNTRIRDAADGKKTGHVLSKGSVVDLLAQPVAAGGYTWYNIRTSKGLVGWVRGDCATATIGSTGGSIGGSTGSLPATGTATFIKLPADTVLFTSQTKPASGGVNVSANTVLMMASADTYTVGTEKYCTVYYNNAKYNAVYSEVSAGIMQAEDVEAHMKTLLANPLPYTLKMAFNLKGNVYVYTLQTALAQLGYYTGNKDGEYGTGTASAVRNFQRANDLEVDGEAGNATWTKLNAAINASSSAGGGATTLEEFVAGVTSIEKANWDYGDNGGALFANSSYATVLDTATGKIYRVFRYYGGNHADVVPASTADTKILCEIAGFTKYTDDAPPAAHLANIIKVGKDQLNDNHTWPDFGGHVFGQDVGGVLDRRASLIRPEGSSKVYAVSIYAWPHGYTGEGYFANGKFPNGMKFHEYNNCYGMLCCHFVGSKTHTDAAINSEHQNAINTAYSYAQSKWPSQCQ